MKIELLEIWDWETGKPTGIPVERKKSHREGIPHEGVHLWIIKNISEPEILFQKRASTKDTAPGVLDITVGGHVPFGLKKNKIQKEAEEEIGISPSDEELIDLGWYKYEEVLPDIFHREFQHIYLMYNDMPLDNYRFNDGEVEGIYSVPIKSLDLLMKKDFTFTVSGFNHSAGIFSQQVSRREFHPLLFAPSMKRYMEVLLNACNEFFNTGKVRSSLNPSNVNG